VYVYLTLKHVWVEPSVHNNLEVKLGIRTIIQLHFFLAYFHWVRRASMVVSCVELLMWLCSVPHWFALQESKFFEYEFLILVQWKSSKQLFIVDGLVDKHPVYFDLKALHRIIDGHLKQIYFRFSNRSSKSIMTIVFLYPKNIGAVALLSLDQCNDYIKLRCR
jgi:hypothetical protein